MTAKGRVVGRDEGQRGVLPMVVFFTDGDTTHDVMPFPVGHPVSIDTAF